MIPDRLQYFLTFLERPKIWPNMDPRTPYFSSKYFTIYKKNVGTSLDNIIFISDNLKFSNCWKVYVPNFWNVETWKFKFWKFESWKLEIWKIRHLILQVRTLTIWEFIFFQMFGHLIFYQRRESLAPLNIPTPTLAPDHLLGGPRFNAILCWRRNFVFFDFVMILGVWGPPRRSSEDRAE